MKRLYLFSETPAGAPRVGNYTRNKGVHYIIESVETTPVEDGYSQGLPIDDGYRHTMMCRQASPSEAQAIRQGGQKALLEQRLRAVSGPPDDERDRPRIEEERDRLRAELEAMED